jgi:hypothetical protein
MCNIKIIFTMKKNLMFTIAALIIFSGCKKEEDETTTTPPYAASAQTWVFGGLTWSDAIHDPACNKQDFDGGTKDNPKADGRSYTYGGRTCYYYSGRYVTEHAATLCPSPWRVPSRDDISTLVEADDASAERIASSWGFGGFALEGNIHEASSHLYLWSSRIDDNGGALYFWNGYGDASYEYDNQDALPGFQVRCVK